MRSFSAKYNGNVIIICSHAWDLAIPYGDSHIESLMQVGSLDMNTGYTCDETPDGMRSGALHQLHSVPARVQLRWHADNQRRGAVLAGLPP